MRVFKTYFKILKNGALVAIIINLAIAVLIATIFMSIPEENNKSFKKEKPTITIFNNDDSEFTDKFLDYVEKNTKQFKIENNTNAKQKALFYRDTSCIVTIPEGFGDAFVSKNPINLKLEKFPDATNGNIADIIINNYLSTYNMYQQSTNLSMDEIIKKIDADLSNSTKVVLENNSVRSHMSGKSIFYNYSCFIIMTILIVSIGTVSFSFRSKDIKRRINCSTMSLSNYNMQIGLGHFVVSLGMFFVVLTLGIVMFDVNIATTAGMLHILNMFIFVLVALNLAYLLSSVVTRKSLDAVANVVVLGSCFLGGSFVPQEFLGDGVKATAVVNPVYWFVKANNTVASVTDYSFSNIKDYYLCLGIELLFSLAFLTITLVISKVKRTEN